VHHEIFDRNRRWRGGWPSSSVGSVYCNFIRRISSAGVIYDSPRNYYTYIVIIGTSLVVIRVCAIMLSLCGRSPVRVTAKTPRGRTWPLRGGRTREFRIAESQGEGGFASKDVNAANPRMPTQYFVYMCTTYSTRVFDSDDSVTRVCVSGEGILSAI